eukprot:551835_1
MSQHWLFVFNIIALFVYVSKAYEVKNNTIYVSRNGMNTETCGTFLNPCATLFFASNNSFLLPEANLDGEIDVETIFYVIDGQNETEIQLYIDRINMTTEHYHPCLPQTNFRNCKIIFDETFIKSITDWYPVLCSNQYIYFALFEQNDEDGYTLRNRNNGKTHFVNLIMDKYNNEKFQNETIVNYDQWSIIGHRMICENCSFINISFKCPENKDRNSLINVVYLELIHTTISNISIKCNSASSMFRVSPDYNPFSTLPDLILANTYVTIVWSNYSLFLTNSLIIMVNDCVFHNIHAGHDIFGEEEYANENVYITNTVFSNIHQSIYISNSEKGVSSNILNIYMENVNFIISNSNLLDRGLIEIDNPTNIWYNNSNVHYQYDLMKHCALKTNYLPEYGYVKAMCNTQQTFLRSYGNSELSNVWFNIELLHQDTFHQYIANILSVTMSQFNIYYVWDIGEFIDTSGHVFYGALLENLGQGLGFETMRLSNVKVTPFAFHPQMILTEKSIIMDNVTVMGDHDDNEQYLAGFMYNFPEILESKFMYSHMNYNFLVIDASITSNKYTVSIRDSWINGVIQFIAVSAGELDKLEILNSHFENVSIVLEAYIPDRFLSEIIIDNCYFVNTYDVIFTLANVNNLVVSSSYFNNWGLTKILKYDELSINENNIILVNNTFEYRELSEFEKEYLNLFQFEYTTKYNYMITIQNSNIHMASNYFGYSNNLQHRSLYLTHSHICLSNNTFFNGAIDLLYSNISSCYRQNVLQICQNDTQKCCNKYGKIQVDLIDKMGYFILNDTIHTPIQLVDDLEGTFIVLDNTVFQIMDNRTHLVLPKVMDFMLLDTFIESVSETNISYDASICNVSCNQMINTSFITQIQMKCDLNIYQRDIGTVKNFWDVSERVKHGIIYGIKFIPSDNGLYFPGEFFLFNHSIVDKFDNVIDDYNHSVTIIASITSKGYSQQIFIGENGFCFICERGIYIPSIILNDVGNIFNIRLEDTKRELIVSDINITVSKCPLGYGILSNTINTISNGNNTDSTISHCNECPENFFQLFPNSINDCINCQTGNDNNEGFKCKGGDNIIVSKHYWIAIKGITNIDFDGNAGTHIISSRCPYGYCCTEQNGCNYLRNHYNNNKSTLCSKHRDPDVFLCGACMPLYSESMSSTNCTKCDSIISYEWLVYTFALSLIISLFLIISKLKKTKNINNKKSKQTKKK